MFSAVLSFSTRKVCFKPDKFRFPVNQAPPKWMKWKPSFYDVYYPSRHHSIMFLYIKCGFKSGPIEGLRLSGVPPYNAYKNSKKIDSEPAPTTIYRENVLQGKKKENKKMKNVEKRQKDPQENVLLGKKMKIKKWK